MIQKKITKVICDNCGKGIYDYGDISVSKCLGHLKKIILLKLFIFIMVKYMSSVMKNVIRNGKNEMPRDKRNSIRIFWIEQDKEKSARIYPKNVPENKWENGIELYTFGLTQVCRYFNVLTPDDLEIPVKWCYDSLPTSSIDPDLSWIEKCNQIYNTDEYEFWYQLKRETWACQATDSMFSDAYKYLIDACRSHKDKKVDYDRDYEDVNEHLTNQDWKEPYWVGYLMNI